LPVIRHRADEEARSRAFRLKGGYFIPAVALGLCIWIAAQSTQKSWEVFGWLLVAGLALYGLAKFQARRPEGRGA
jgi:hypothetical protein